MVYALNQQSLYGTVSSRDRIHVSGGEGTCYI